jgi:hypothetical protein
MQVATQEQIVQTTYTDVDLEARIDAGTSLENVASVIWLEKAAAYGRLVDMQEGASRRSLSQLQAAALRMSTQFSGGGDSVVATAGRRSTTRPIERV